MQGCQQQLVVRFIIDLVLAERNIADGEVIEIPAVGSLKAGNGNVCLRVKHFGDSACDGVQLHTVQTAVRHAFGQHTEEIADAHARFQNVAGLEAHVLDCIIDGADNGGAGKVRAQRRLPGSGMPIIAADLNCTSRVASS